MESLDPSLTNLTADLDEDHQHHDASVVGDYNLEPDILSTAESIMAAHHAQQQTFDDEAGQWGFDPTLDLVDYHHHHHHHEDEEEEVDGMRVDDDLQTPLRQEDDGQPQGGQLNEGKGERENGNAVAGPSSLGGGSVTAAEDGSAAGGEGNGLTKYGKKPGRPKGSKDTKPRVSHIEGRPLGRARGSKDVKPRVYKEGEKKRTGRPKGSKDTKPRVIGKPIGRPKGSKDSKPRATPVVTDKKVGRPKGSKNKPRPAPALEDSLPAAQDHPQQQAHEHEPTHHHPEDDDSGAHMYEFENVDYTGEALEGLMGQMVEGGITFDQEGGYQ